MMSCAEARRLLSRSRDERLALRLRVGLRLHVLLCQFCRNFGEQVQVVGKIAHEVAAEHAAEPERLDPLRTHECHDEPRLSPEARARLEAALRAHHSPHEPPVAQDYDAGGP